MPGLKLGATPSSSVQMPSTGQPPSSRKRPREDASSDSSPPRRDRFRGSVSEPDIHPPVVVDVPAEDEAVLIKKLLEPPPIEGTENWGILPDPEGQCDPELEAKVMKFHLLKRQGKHFNDTLMESKSFRNPHIHTTLVQFVDIKETATNFPKEIWDPLDVEESWYAENIAAAQKDMSEKLSASQAPGQRSRIAFESAKSSTASSSKKGKEKERSHHRHPTRGDERSIYAQGGADSSSSRSRFEAKSSSSDRRHEERGYYPDRRR